MNLFSLDIASILEIGKNIFSTVSINYELIFGLGCVLNALLILLIALVWPSKKSILAKQRLKDAQEQLYRRRQPRRIFPWKQTFLLLGLLLLLVGICLLSSSVLIS